MKKRRQSNVAVNLVERAVIAAQWRQNVATARIHALMGENARELVNQAGRVFFVVLGAAIQQRLSADRLELRILRGAVNATHDQAGVEPIDPVRRASILAGLEAAAKMLHELPHPALVCAACVLAAKLKNSDVCMSGFQKLIEGAT